MREGGDTVGAAALTPRHANPALVTRVPNERSESQAPVAQDGIDQHQNQQGDADRGPFGA
jgi:hypothetical protein